MIEHLGEYIQQLLSKKVSPVFVGDLPSLSTEGVAIILADGEVNTSYFGMKNTIYYPLITIAIRTAEYAVGSKYCETIREILHEHTSEKILGIAQQGAVMYLGRNEQKLCEFQLTFRIIVEEGL